MLVWLASYPRSGNTYVRILLKDVFGVNTWSAYEESDKSFDPEPGRNFAKQFGWLQSLVQGCKETDGASDIKSSVLPINASKIDKLIHEAHVSKDLYIIKTHERPLTTDPAIYLVRDGRSCVISYFHFLNEIANIQVSLEQVIDGHVFAGSWSEHFAAWDPEHRQNTLLLHYEVISKNPAVLASELAAFLKLIPIGTFSRTFRELNAAFPEFFRKGDNAPGIEEMKPLEDRFMRLHGRLMERLGYKTHDRIAEN